VPGSSFPLTTSAPVAYLSNLGVGELKLDRSFITGLTGQGRRESELVRATIDLGHAMGLRVVAEGVEDQETLDLLAEMGCDLAQGYYISRPKPADELAFRSGPPTSPEAHPGTGVLATVPALPGTGVPDLSGTGVLATVPALPATGAALAGPEPSPAAA
jgi:diguanylate cyclase